MEVRACVRLHEVIREGDRRIGFEHSWKGLREGRHALMQRSHTFRMAAKSRNGRALHVILAQHLARIRIHVIYFFAMSSHQFGLNWISFVWLVSFVSAVLIFQCRGMIAELTVPQRCCARFNSYRNISVMSDIVQRVSAAKLLGCASPRWESKRLIGFGTSKY